MIATKYSAKYVYWDTQKQAVRHKSDIELYRARGRLKLPKHVVRFDSHHEFRVYLELCRMYGSKNIIRQVSREIIPAGYCYPKGKKWKIDFALVNNYLDSEIISFIEAKGAITSEFINNLAWVEQFNELVLWQLMIVFPNKIPTNNKVINSLIERGWSKQIITLKELRQRNKLI